MLYRVIVSTFCVFAFCLASHAGQSAESGGAMVKRRAFALSPGMGAVAKPGVHLLTESTPDADRMPELGLSIEPEQAYRWVHDTGRPISLRVSGGDRTSECVLTCWDWENRPVAQTRFTAPFDAKLRVDVQGRGAYVLTLDSMSDGACKGRLVRSFSVCPSNNDRRALWAKSGFWVGQCSFPGWQGAVMGDGHTAYPEGMTAETSADLDAELVARMGVRIARLNTPIDRRDQAGMDLDFTLMDRCVKAFASRGLKLDLHLFVPYGAGRGPIQPQYADIPEAGAVLYPIQEKPYRHYVREIIRRYGKYAAFAQIRNEPANQYQYMGNADDFVWEVATAADEVRKTRPGLPVTNGGYCNTEDAVKGIAKRLVGVTDFTSYHWHGDLVGLKWFLPQIQAMHRAAGRPMPRFANTEMGYYMPDVGFERRNAVYEMQKLLYCWAHDHAGVLLYSSRELWWPRQFSAEVGGVGGISDYGFVDHFFCPRFVYGAASAFLDRYAGFRFDRILVESDNLHAYAFKSGGRKMIALFSIGQPVQVRLETNAKSASLLDPMGNETPITDPKSITLTTGEYPQTVVLDGASKVELAQ